MKHEPLESAMKHEPLESAMKHEPLESAMKHEPLESAPWWTHGHVWLVIAGPAIVVVAALVTVWIALAHPDPVLAGDYYRRGVEINGVERKAPEPAGAGLALGSNDLDDHRTDPEERLPDAFADFPDATKLEPGSEQRLDRSIKIRGRHDEVVDRRDVVRMRRGS